MKEFWMYTSIFFVGSTGVLLLIVFVQMKKMGNDITIRRQVQKNRRSPNNRQEYQATQQLKNKKRRMFNLKKGKNEK
jgi:hypothetical protein